MNSKKYRQIKYPVKIGYSDESGKDENVITDDNNTTLIHGWGDCCKIGGIQDKSTAIVIVELMNRDKPKIMIPYYGEGK